MVAQTQFQPQNADALFSPDQWLNQFSNFNNAALPWPSSYAGAPTDAMGRPIQSFVDATNAAQQQYQQQPQQPDRKSDPAEFPKYGKNDPAKCSKYRNNGGPARCSQFGYRQTRVVDVSATGMLSQFRAKNNNLSERF